jgi:predicted outer membrane repeat protein
LFIADDKNTHSIPRPLKINYPHGQMQITNSTKISMCEGVYLLNKDSLIIEGPPQSKGMVIPSCAGIDSIAKGSDNSMLIVNAGSALVLNAGSRTYVKNGGAIYVKQNGSLVIKDGAFLQIGDSGTCVWF